MKITVKTFATLRRFIDKESHPEIEPGTTMRELLEMLTASHPGLKNELFDEQGDLRKYVNILKNGRNIHFIDELGTVVEEDDIIAIFPPSGGG